MNKSELREKIKQLVYSDVARISDSNGIEFVIFRRPDINYDIDLWYDGYLEESIEDLAIDGIFEQFDRVDMCYDDETKFEYIVRG